MSNYVGDKPNDYFHELFFNTCFPTIISKCFLNVFILGGKLIFLFRSLTSCSGGKKQDLLPSS